MESPQLVDHVIAALFGLLLPLAAFARGRSALDPADFDASQRVRFAWSTSVSLWLMAGGVALAWTRGDRTLAELGLGPLAPPGTALAALLVGVALALYALDCALRLGSAERRAETRRRWLRDTPFMPRSGREYASFLVMALSAGLCEEVVFRGYLIRYGLALFEPTGLGPVLAVLAPALVFGVAHLYQGWSAVARIVVGGVLFGAAFLASGSLWLPIAAHAGIDAFGGLLGLSLLPRESGGGAATPDTAPTGS